MNNTLAVEQPGGALDHVGVPRAALTAAFVVLGLILLFFAARHIGRHHKTRRHHRY
jgi:hypothetical protein